MTRTDVLLRRGPHIQGAHALNEAGRSHQLCDFPLEQARTGGYYDTGSSSEQREHDVELSRLGSGEAG